MPTRCNVVIKEGGKYTSQFYRHYDGYLAGTGEELKELCEDCEFDANDIFSELIHNGDYEDEPYDEGLHFDIGYLYVIDTDAKTLTAYAPKYEEDVFSVEWILNDNYYHKVELV